MLTTLELKSKALAKILHAGHKTYAADQAKIASDFIFQAVAAGKARQEEAGEAFAWFGNHSAVSQYGKKQGFFPVSDSPPDAMSIATQKEWDALKQAEMEELEKMGKGKK